MAGKERIIWVAISGILVVLLYFAQGNQHALDEMADQLKQAQDEVVNLKTRTEEDKEAVQEYVDIVSNFERKIQDLEKQVEAQGQRTAQILTPDDIVYLKKRGLDQPEKDIEMALMAGPRLFDRQGVLGGTFDFYDPEGIRVLGREWVLADFEDGHKMGRALLKYKVQKGKFQWTIMDIYLLSE